MDSLITAAARALAAGDALVALKHVALREDAPALALRGIAMARLGDLTRAKTLLRRAARAFGAREAVARARCIVAEAEIALVSRELVGSTKALDAAQTTLAAQGDRANAAYAQCLQMRHSLLIGRLDDAARIGAGLDAAALPPAARAVYELAVAGIALRRVQATSAQDAIARAAAAADRAGVPALAIEVERALALLHEPAARLVTANGERLIRLDDVEAVFASDALVVDACRHLVRDAGHAVSLASRPVLFALARALAEAWPGDAARDALILRAFRAKRADESHRARLRVEMGRLRALLKPFGRVEATSRGFALSPHDGCDIVVLARISEGPHTSLLALLADGEAWSSSALALALGASQRQVQRALDALSAAGTIQSFGRARARRWTMPATPGIATSLLLTMPLPRG